MYKPFSTSAGGATMDQESPVGEMSVSFSGFRLETDGSLFRGDSLIHLPPRELAALRLLLANAGQIVTSSELKQALWGDVHVTADSVPKCLSSLRARLQPDECIQTVYKRGYRLMTEVRSAQPDSPAALPRLAILPFAPSAGVAEHLGTAIAEETIFRLSNAERPMAAILARDSVFTLAMRGLTAQQIGETLNADLVLAGTLSTFHSHVRLRVEMIRVRDGVQIWVEDLLVNRNRLVGLESDLAVRLDFRLNARTIASEKARSHAEAASTFAGSSGSSTATAEEDAPSFSNVRRARVVSISAAAEALLGDTSDAKRREAYDTFLRGHHEWQTLERHRMQDGMRELTHATEMDPALIAAKIDLVHLCVTQAFYGYMPPIAAANLARRTAESVPNVPQQAAAMLPSLGWISFHVDRNLPAALWAFKLSAHLPHDIWTTRERSQLALSRHRFDEATALLRSALEGDPFGPWLHARLAWTQHLAGQAAASVECVRRGVALFPQHDGIAFYGSMILTFNGDTAEGLRLAESVVALQPHIDLLKAVHAYALAAAGKVEEAKAIIERLQWMSRERFVIQSFTPAVHVALGDFDAAIADLNAANEARCPWFFQMLADPRLTPLQDRAEFKQLVNLLAAMEGSGDAVESPV